MRLVASILPPAWHPRTTKVIIPVQARIADPRLDHHVPLQEARRDQRLDLRVRPQEGHRDHTPAARRAQLARLDLQREPQAVPQEALAVRLVRTTDPRDPVAVLAMAKVVVEAVVVVVAIRHLLAAQNLSWMTRNKKKKPSSSKAPSLPFSQELCFV